MKVIDYLIDLLVTLMVVTTVLFVGAAFTGCAPYNPTYVTEVTEVTEVQGAELDWVDPCPAIESDFPELLLLMNNTTFYAVYSSGKDIHLTEVPDGTYKTTDDRDARFEVNGNTIECLDD